MFGGKGPKGYRRSDERIYEDVCEVLMESPEIDAREMEVEVKDAMVTLRGVIEDRYTKRLAEDLAMEVNGVRDVINLLQMKAPQSLLGDVTGTARNYRGGLVDNGTGMN